MYRSLPQMDPVDIINKFGSHYQLDEYTYTLGIHYQFAEYLALKFANRTVLETCTGGGFTAIALAKYANHVYTFEIDHTRQLYAKENAKIAGVYDKISFINSDIYSIDNAIATKIDSAFIDPDWNVKSRNHIFKFINSNTVPPSDHLFNFISSLTRDIVLIQPPYINMAEFNILPDHKLERLYLNDNLELLALSFGMLSDISQDEYRIYQK